MEMKQIAAPETALEVVTETVEMTALAVIEQPSTDLVVADEPPVKTGFKFLSFTLVDGYLRGEHRCRYELHATGCRDLKKAQRTMPSYEILGERQGRHDDTLDGVINQAIEDGKGTLGRKDIWVQPCCNLKRMQAIGRA